jgi:hypothetical protein
MNINKNIVAGETIPVLPRVNSLQALSRLKPKKGSEWNTIAFALNRDIIDKDGKVDDLYGMIFSLGSFDDQEKAENHAKNVISLTGHPGVIVAKYGCAVPLSSKFDPNNVVDVPVDLKGKMINLESSQYKHDKETFEKRVKQEKEMVQEAEDETDINHIEHFKRQCFLAIKNRANYQMHQKQAEEYWNSYKKRETIVREHFKNHPDHEQNWLSYFKEKLKERGEAQIYDGIESAYLELRNELLGLNNDVCNNDVCNNDVCNNDVCKTDVCKTDVCNNDVCKTDVCKTDVCKTDVCKTDVCNNDVCNNDVCNNDVCNNDVCNNDVCNNDVCNNDVCNNDVCNNDVCNNDVCNNDVCNNDVCNNDVCNNDVCNNDVCNNDVCNNDVCKTDVCKTDVCNNDVCKTYVCNNDVCNNDVCNNDVCYNNIIDSKNDDIIENKDINNDKIDLKNDDNKNIKSDKNDDIIIESKDINNDKIDLKNDDNKNIKSDKNKKKKKKN